MLRKQCSINRSKSFGSELTFRDWTLGLRFTFESSERESCLFVFRPVERNLEASFDSVICLILQQYFREDPKERGPGANFPLPLPPPASRRPCLFFVDKDFSPGCVRHLVVCSSHHGSIVSSFNSEAHRCRRIHVCLSL